MHQNWIATGGWIGVALVFILAGPCEGQVKDPSDLTLEEAGLVSDLSGPSHLLAVQSSGTVSPRIAGTSPPDIGPVGNGIDLAGLLDLAIAQSPRLSVHRAKVGASQMSALATGLFPNPVVEGGGKDVSGGDSGLVLGISQELPINGSRKMDRQAANLRYAAERATLEREVQVVLSEVESAYVNLLSGVELVGVDRRGLDIATESLRLISEKYEAGLTSALPHGLAKSEQANARRALQVAEGNLAVARKTLAGLLAMDEASLPNIVGDLHVPLLPTDQIEKAPLRPDLQAAGLNVQAAQSSTQAARKMRIPNPTIGYQREEAEDTENFFTIGLEIPLFNNGVAKVREGMAGEQVAYSEKTALSRTIQSEVEVATQRLASAREAVSIYENEIRPSIDQSQEAAKVAFQSGTTDLSLLLQTQASLIEHERNYIRALQELRDSEIAYRLAIGTERESIK